MTLKLKPYGRIVFAVADGEVERREIQPASRDPRAIEARLFASPRGIKAIEVNAFKRNILTSDLPHERLLTVPIKHSLSSEVPGHQVFYILLSIIVCSLVAGISA